MGTHLIVLSESFPMNTNMTAKQKANEHFDLWIWDFKWQKDLNVGPAK